jgi:glycopeptide antibiotics resistance protein
VTPTVTGERARRRVALLISAAYLAGLALLVVTPISTLLDRLTVRLYVIYRADLRLPGNVLPEDFGEVLNVLLFVPLGVLLVLVLRRSWLEAALVAVALSGALELVQLVPALHREATLGDVLTNGLGGLIGAGVAGFARSRAGRGGTDPGAPSA